MKNLTQLNGFPRYDGESSTKYLTRILATKEGLQYIEGKSIRDISYEMNCPKSTISDVIQKARHKELIDIKKNKPLTYKTARELHVIINRIDKEIKELKNILKGY